MPSGLDGNRHPVTTGRRRAVLESVADLVGPGRAVVGIDGASGSGKSTFADELAAALGARGRSVLRASIDSFHRPRAARYRLGVDSPEGYYRESHDLARLRQVLLDPFRDGGRVRTAAFDEPSDSPVRSPPVPVPPDGVLVFDGLFLLRPALADRWDVSVFLAADGRREAAWHASGAHDLPEDPDARAREVERRRSRRRRYVEGQALYEREASPRERADVLIDNDDLRRPVIVAPAPRGTRRAGP